jgi:molybdate transport system ATP-binding protein
LGTLDLAVDLVAGPGSVVAVLGPNGAGKTTLLRALAGLLALDAGHVRLDGEVLDDPAAGVHVPAHRRPIGVVFQQYLLFDNMTALDNVAFGLVNRGATRRAARRQAAAWLDRVGAGDVAGSRPRRLSGGQAQRVALARALAGAPRLLLLDEPLAAVDVAARADLRAELRHHLAEAPGVRLLVTHDPLEAMLLADRLVVIEAGRVVQRGVPADVAARPRTDYVARFAGVNLLRGVAVDGQVRVDGGARLVAAGAPDGPVLVTVRPEAVALHRREPDGTPRNVWQGVVVAVDGHAGHGARVRVQVEGTAPGAVPAIVAEVTPAAIADLGLHPGSPVWVAVKATEVTAYPA